MDSKYHVFFSTSTMNVEKFIVAAAPSGQALQRAVA
jgi:hypothetical protein